MGFEIITDSTSDLTTEQIEELNIAGIANLQIIADGKVYESYVDGKSVNIKQFYDMMRDEKAFTTSLAPLSSVEEKARELFDAGKDILYIGFSSALSGNFQSESTFMEALQKSEYPQRKFYTIDSLCAAGGEGLMVYYAAKLRSEGKTIEETYAWLIENRLNFAHWFTVDDLHFLERGGRVSKTTAIAGTLLSIKPILHVDNEGRLINVSKTRGRRRSLDALVDAMEQTALQPVEEQMVFIGHGDCLDDAEYMRDQIKQRLGVKNFVINYVDPVIGAHSGPGTIALFFLATHR